MNGSIHICSCNIDYRTNTAVRKVFEFLSKLHFYNEVPTESNRMAITRRGVIGIGIYIKKVFPITRTHIPTTCKVELWI